MTPGSRFLKALNRRPRAPEVRYHILAGDHGFVTKELRAGLNAQVQLLSNAQGLLGKMAHIGLNGAKGVLDEATDGLGDGCVSVASTKLEGVNDRIVIHANHVEIIRAPLFFPDPGPVASMPYLLEWLKAD